MAMSFCRVLIFSACALTTAAYAHPHAQPFNGSNTMTQTAEKNDFLSQKSEEKDVTTTESGLRYKVIAQGNGNKPARQNSVTVNYEGSLEDGTVFDSSYKRGTPISFGVTDVIPGWTEALQLMPEGSTWELYIPSDLAYGPNGIPGVIPGNSTLIFKVELISVN
jgi:FKBP-type peptidyl-prolyl cis-trans isomerase